MAKKQIAHAERKHSDFSASGSERWLNCPASVSLSKTVPPEPESFYAKEGTLAHECLEYIVTHGGKVTKANMKENGWTEEMVKHAKTAREEIFKLKPSVNADLLVEEKVALNADAFGTLDYAWVDVWGTLVVIDYKFGKGKLVEAFDEETEKANSQLMFYASALARKYNYEFEKIKLVVIQPRAYSEDGKTVREHDVTPNEILSFIKEVNAAIVKAKGPKPIARADESWCHWCPAKIVCPEIKENALRSASLFVDEDMNLIAAPEPKKLTQETLLPNMLSACDKLEIWIKAVRERAFDLAKSGKKIKGYKLVMKRATRTWLPDAEDKAFKLFKDKIYDTTFLSPAQLEKKLGPEGKQFAEKYTTSLSSGVTLAPESDKRPEVKDAILFDI